MESFENAVFLSTCRRTKTEVFEYYDVINYILLTLRTFVRNAIVLKTLASCLRVDGRKRRFSNSMMSYIVYTSYITSITHGRCVGWYLFPSFERFCLDGGKRFEYTKRRRVFWGKRREKIKKISGYVWKGPESLNRVTLCTAALSLKQTEWT